MRPDTSPQARISVASFRASLAPFVSGVERKADFFACDLSTYTWSELPCKGNMPSPRYFHSCCIHGNKLYTYGEANATYLLHIIDIVHTVS